MWVQTADDQCRHLPGGCTPPRSVILELSSWSSGRRWSKESIHACVLLGARENIGGGGLVRATALIALPSPLEAAIEPSSSSLTLCAADGEDQSMSPLGGCAWTTGVARLVRLYYYSSEFDKERAQLSGFLRPKRKTPTLWGTRTAYPIAK